MLDFGQASGCGGCVATKPNQQHAPENKAFILSEYADRSGRHRYRAESGVEISRSFRCPEKATPRVTGGRKATGPAHAGWPGCHQAARLFLCRADDESRRRIPPVRSRALECAHSVCIFRTLFGNKGGEIMKAGSVICLTLLVLSLILVPPSHASLVSVDDAGFGVDGFIPYVGIE